MKRLFLLPPLVVVAYGAARVWAPTDEAAIWVHRLAPMAAELLAAGGCLAAALAFARGDYLRTAWGLTGLGYVLLAAGAVQTGPVVGDVSWVRAATTVIANVLSVIAYVRFARTWSVAGMSGVDDRRRRVLAFVLSSVIGLALTAGAYVLGFLAFRAGVWPFGVVVVFGALGDMVGLIVLAPVAMNALALRGGQLGWPWGLLTASLISWLLFSAQSIVVIVMGVDRDYAWMHAGAEVFRLLACTFTFIAAMLQRSVLE